MSLISANARLERRVNFALVTGSGQMSPLFTYFVPMQFRGPMLNGCIAFMSSCANSGSPRNLSGWNSSGLVKFRVL